MSMPTGSSARPSILEHVLRAEFARAAMILNQARSLAAYVVGYREAEALFVWRCDETVFDDDQRRLFAAVLGAWGCDALVHVAIATVTGDPSPDRGDRRSAGAEPEMLALCATSADGLRAASIVEVGRDEAGSVVSLHAPARAESIDVTSQFDEIWSLTGIFASRGNAARTMH